MKVSKWAIMIALAGGFTAAPAFAQSGMRQPSSVARTGFEYGSYDYYAADEPAASPSDTAAPPAPAAPDASAPAPAAGGTCSNCDSGCDSGCSTCQDCAMECPEAEEPWRLFGNCCCLKERGIDMRGWIAAGYFGNFDSPASNWNGPVTFGDRDELMLNQAYLIAEKAIDTSEQDWDLGGRIDVLFGSDYRFNIARGLSARDNFTAKWDSSRFYGWDLPQLYAEVGFRDLSVKVGRFYTIIGYQVFTAPDNFFYSIPYTFQYGEPFTHTGFLATWKVNDQLSLLGGMTNGWDNFEDVYDSQSFLGGANFTSSDGNSKLALAGTIGDEERTFGTVNPQGQRWVYSVVYSRTLTDRLSYVFQHDNGRQDGAAGGNQPAEWYGINQYLFYKVNCCWTLGLRAEWFRDDDGYRVAAPGDYAAQGFSTNPASQGGWAGNFYDVALGANWKPNANFIFRPELRYDWYSGPDNANGNQPYDDGASTDQWLLGGDVIFLY